MQRRTKRQVLVVSSRSLFRIAIRSVLAALDLDHLVEANGRTTADDQLTSVPSTVIIADLTIGPDPSLMAEIMWYLDHPSRPTVVAICSKSDFDAHATGARYSQLERLAVVDPDVEPAALVAVVGRAFGDHTNFALPRRYDLTPRQREILGLVASGRSNQEIGHRLVIAPGTVKRHLNDTFALLNAHSRLDAVNRARSLGLI